MTKQGIVHHRQGANQHDVAVAPQNARQLLVLGRFRRFGEQDVKTDDLGASLVKLLGQAGVQAARPWPLPSDLAHRGFVDGDDDNRIGGRQRTAQDEQQIESFQFQEGKKRQVGEKEGNPKGDYRNDSRRQDQ